MMNLILKCSIHNNRFHLHIWKIVYFAWNTFRRMRFDKKVYINRFLTALHVIPVFNRFQFHMKNKKRIIHLNRLTFAKHIHIRSDAHFNCSIFRQINMPHTYACVCLRMCVAVASLLILLTPIINDFQWMAGNHQQSRFFLHACVLPLPLPPLLMMNGWPKIICACNWSRKNHLRGMSKCFQFPVLNVHHFERFNQW